MPKVRRAQQAFERMSGRQRTERSDKIPNVTIVGADADPSAEFLQHIDASPAVRRVNHEMHRSVRFEHAAQGAEAGIGIREMMENPGAHNLIEAHPKMVYLLDGKLVDVEILEVVFLLEFLRTLHTGCATVDTCDLSRGPAQRMLGRLRCPAARDEDGLIVLIRSCGPE